MKPKRILHIIGRMDRAGAETMLMNLYRVLNKDKYQFDFLYFTNDKCDFDNEIQSLGGKIYRINKSNIFKRTIAIYNLLKTNKQFHAIHTHTLFNNGLNLLAMYFAKYKRRIAHSHSTSDTNNNSLFGKIYQLFSKFLINKFATKYVACGIEASEYLFYSNKQVIQLPNAIDVNKFNDCGKKHKHFLKKELNLNDECLIISQIGRFLTVKNHAFSIKLANILKEKNIDFHMVFAGDGELKDELINLSKKNKVNNNITFLGVRNDIPKILAGSDVMIMPSLYEGFPVVLVESQSVGVPAFVSTNVSSEVDLKVDKIFFYSLNNIDHWANTIINIKNIDTSINDKERVSIISNKGFNIEKSVEILEKIYF